MNRRDVLVRVLAAMALAVCLRGVLAPERLDAAGRGKSGGEAFSGLAFRDIAGGQVVVSWIYPGPLDGDGFVSRRADLARPDLVVALNGAPPRSARAAQDRIRAMAPGDTMHLDVRTSRRRGGAIADTLDHEEAVRRIDVVLADRAMWAGTIGMKPSRDVPWPPSGEPRLLDPDDPANALGAAVAELQLDAAADTLAGVFAQWQEDFPDFHSLSHVRELFADPFRLPEIARSVTSPTAYAPADPMGTALQLMRRALDASHGSDGPARPGRGPIGLRAAAELVRRANRGDFPLHWWIAEKHFEESLREATRRAAGALGDAAADTTLPRKVLALLRVPHETFYLTGDVTRDHAEVMRRSRDVDFAQLADALEALAPLIALSSDGATDWSVPPEHVAKVPDALAGAVEGSIRSAHFAKGVGWIVIGGDGNNRYDTAKLAGILDPGGDDEYRSSAITPGARAIVDLAGNDRYDGGAEGGPATALFGVTLVDDRAGDDSYEGGLLATGAASFGAALLLDRAGNDRYAGALWSIGAAMYGAGIVMDLGGGGDTYAGDFLCQGVGGPRGLGAIVDEAGNDLYRANGPTPSAYGTPGVYQAFSQGIGFGFRLYAAGGAGILCDLAGDDRYEAGEFAQGGAYYFALGVLWDAAGRDSYYGNRYGQGFGVHQAAGALLDDAGDDAYWSMTAASQGAGWDVGCGLLLDQGGNDHYRCDDLGQGAAAQQAIGMHIDLGGDDTRQAGGGTVQGAAGSNEYHWVETGTGSLGVLLDSGTGEDRYSAARPNGATLAPAPPEGAVAGAAQHGIFIDR